MSKLLSVVTAFALAGIAQAGNVIIPVGNMPITVKQGDTVRIPAKTIAGGTIKGEVSGPAKMTEQNIIEMAGKNPVIGNNTKEFDLKPTGKGTIKLKVTTTNPTGAPPTTTEYEITVE